MRAVDDGKCRIALRRYRAFGVFVFLLAGLVLPTSGAFGHGVEHRIEYGEAVLVHFSSHHDGPMAGAGFRVFSPDGQKIFASGKTDALGRAVFVADQPGIWRVLMATEDGHGAEVEVAVKDGRAVTALSPDQDSNTSRAGRIPAAAAGVGYLFGLAGLLALWRARR